MTQYDRLAALFVRNGNNWAAKREIVNRVILMRSAIDRVLKIDCLKFEKRPDPRNAKRNIYRLTEAALKEAREK